MTRRITSRSDRRFRGPQVHLAYHHMAMRLRERSALPEPIPLEGNPSRRERLLHAVLVNLPIEVDFIERHWQRHLQGVRNRKRKRRTGWRPGR